MAARNFERQNAPLVVAHRGASSTHPENTLDSFDAAVAAGADVVELDVRLTADGVPVVMHDEDVATTTDGDGPVHELTLAQIKRLDASGGRGPRVEVPTLRDVLESLTGRVGVDLEIKNMPGERSFDSPREATVTAAVALLDDVGFSGPVLISSFNWLSIERARELAPDVATGFLTIAAMEPAAALVYARSAKHDYVLPQAPALVVGGAAFVERAHADGVRVGTWTVDDADAIGRLFEMGVDAIATNDPETAVAVRARAGASRSR